MFVLKESDSCKASLDPCAAHSADFNGEFRQVMMREGKDILERGDTK